MSVEQAGEIDLVRLPFGAPRVRYLLLLLIGLACQDTMSEAHWASAVSKWRRQASVFSVGRYMQDRVKIPLRRLLRAFADILVRIAEEDWGWLKPQTD